MAAIGKDIERAKALLEQGELVGIPTETVYGLAGNALNDRSVTKIFSVKERPSFDPLIVHVPHVSDIQKYAHDIPEAAHKLAEAFWPGPLTLLLNRRDIIGDLVTSGLETVGLRCPNHSLTRELLALLDFPLAAPSANPFGYVSPTTATHVNDQLGNKIQYILDGGACDVGIESTIIGFEQDKPVMYRAGGLSVEQIEAIIGQVKVQTQSTSNPKAPGQLISHYAPLKKLIVGNLEELIQHHAKQTVGIISFQKEFNMKYQRVLSPSGSLEEAARHFFSALRDLDGMPVDLILAEFVPGYGLGRAINDRLKRASSHV